MNISETISFIRDLYGEKEAFIPLHAPTFAGNEKKYLEECIDTTFVSSVGKFKWHRGNAHRIESR